ncbi:MAG: dihydrofolate reductase [Alphaproteobacteria bacterium]|nr:dihydrofolate reductase [Alphaproteobacteria bacterium]
MKVSLIAAVAENGVMGKGDWLPWEIKSEFQYFKKTTLGHPIIFGRKTLETLGGPLPKRENIVVTRDPNYTTEGAVVKHTLEAAITHAKSTAERDGVEQVFVGGGAEIYALALPHADRLYLTEIHLKPDGDTVFPPFDRSQWVEVKREFHKAKEGESADYTITVLERKG